MLNKKKYTNRSRYQHVYFKIMIRKIKFNPKSINKQIVEEKISEIHNKLEARGLSTKLF